MNEFEKNDALQRIDDLSRRVEELEERLNTLAVENAPRELPTPLKSLLKRAA